MDGAVQDCSNSSVLAMELVQSWALMIWHPYGLALASCIYGLAKDCINPSALAMELLQTWALIIWHPCSWALASYMDGAVQDCSNSRALAVELLHSWALTIWHPMSMSMASCKTAVTALLTHWSYCSFTLSHRYNGLNTWCNGMEMVSALLALCGRNLLIMGLLLDNLIKLLNKQSDGWWFETPQGSCDVTVMILWFVTVLISKLHGEDISVVYFAEEVGLSLS